MCWKGVALQSGPQPALAALGALPRRLPLTPDVPQQGLHDHVQPRVEVVLGARQRCAQGPHAGQRDAGLEVWHGSRARGAPTRGGKAKQPAASAFFERNWRNLLQRGTRTGPMRVSDHNGPLPSLVLSAIFPCALYLRDRARCRERFRRGTRSGPTPTPTAFQPQGGPGGSLLPDYSGAARRRGVQSFRATSEPRRRGVCRPLQSLNSPTGATLR